MLIVPTKLREKSGLFPLQEATKHTYMISCTPCLLQTIQLQLQKTSPGEYPFFEHVISLYMSLYYN